MENKKTKKEVVIPEVSTRVERIMIIILALLSVVFMAPIFIVLMNSFKGKFYISDTPFAFPSGETFVGITNYISGILKTGLPKAFCYSLFITVFSVIVIVIFTAMTAWYITRVKTWWTKILYYMFAFAMIIPFQMVMFPMSKIANMLCLDNPLGIIIVYLGFGAGLSVFMFCGFIKAIPIEMEEAAMIDGATRFQCFTRVILPLAKPGIVTQIIFSGLGYWNEYYYANLLLTDESLRTLPVAASNFMGRHNIEYTTLFAALVIITIPAIIVYFVCQKSFVEGLSAGAIKG